MQYQIESNEHLLFGFHFYYSQRLELFDKLNKINSSFFNLSAKDQVNILLYSYSSKNKQFLETSPLICGENHSTGFYMITTSVMRGLNEDIIKLAINFIAEFGRFDRPLIKFNQKFTFYIYIYIYIYIYFVNYILYKFCQIVLIVVFL